MPTRKYHHKSTTGCLECKNARVKCDEGKPECARCARQGRSCSYKRQNNEASPASTSALGQQSSEGSVTLSTYLEDLELMHHYSTQAHISLASEDSIRRTFQQTAVKQALQYPFLLRAIFSFSALHLAKYQRPTPSSQNPGQSPGNVSSPGSSSEQSVSTSGAALSPSAVPDPDPLPPSRARWFARAMADYGESLILARPELEDINDQNCHAALLFSSLVATIRLGIPQVTGDYGPSGVLGYVLESFSLLRGKAAIADNATAWVLKGPLKGAYADRKVGQPRQIPDHILSVIENLETMARALQPESMDAQAETEDGQHLDPTKMPEDRRAAYMFALAGLRAYFACQPGEAAAIRIATAWPVRLPAPFVADLNANEPLALAVLAYYAMMLDDQREPWWVGDTGKRLLLHINSILGPAWDGALGPAKRQMEVEVDFWAHTTSLRAFGEPEGYGDERGYRNDGNSGAFLGFVNSHVGPDGRATDAIKGEQGLTPGQSQTSTPYDVASSTFEPVDDEEGGEPVVQESPFGVSLMTGELPGQSKSLPMHTKLSPSG